MCFNGIIRHQGGLLRLKIHRLISPRSLGKIAIVALAFLLVESFSACHSKSVDALAASTAGQKRVHFKPYLISDSDSGGMAAANEMIPDDWNGRSWVRWNYDNGYIPAQVGSRVEAPDGSAWVQTYPFKLFVWLDPFADRNTRSTPDGAVIHHPNVSLPTALARYVIMPNRRDVTEFRILGYRPVNNFPQAFSEGFRQSQSPTNGEGICMRVSYKKNGIPYDEEFYAYMNRVQRLTSPDGSIGEYHRPMGFIHSMGARAGTLEDKRALLGFIATSFRSNPSWLNRYDQVVKVLQQRFQANFNQNMAQIRAAGERSRQISAQNDAFLRNIDAGLAANRTSSGSSSYSPGAAGNSASFDRGTDAFDQYIRDTEHMQDQNGNVTDQPSAYSYHWSSGFGDYVHTNDPNFNPNQYSNSNNYERMTPAQPEE
jgi:hypothetical protein